MYKDTEFLQLVDAVYDAALDEQRWPEVLTKLCTTVKANASYLWITAAEGSSTDPQPGVGKSLVRAYSSDPEIRCVAYSGEPEKYLEFIPRDSRKARLLPVSTKSNLLTDKPALVQEEVRQDLAHSIDLLIAKFNHLHLSLSSLRSQLGGAFNAQEHDLHRRLAPHIERAFSIAGKLAEDRWSAAYNRQITSIAPEAYNLGILGLSETGKLFYGNSLGMALLKKGGAISLKNGSLQTAEAYKNAELAAKLRNTLSQRRAQFMTLTLMNGVLHPLHLTLLPLDADAGASGFFESGVKVLVFIIQPQRQRVATVRQLMGLFTLSAAEARLVRALARGEDVDCYARLEGLKKTTIRTQLHAALVKTGTTKQKDLVRLITSIPVIRD